MSSSIQSDKKNAKKPQVSINKEPILKTQYIEKVPFNKPAPLNLPENNETWGGSFEQEKKKKLIFGDKVERYFNQKGNNEFETKIMELWLGK